MSYRRIAIRCENASTLTESQQKDFADRVETRIANNPNDLGGYFVTTDGNNWLELEGDSDAVMDEIEDHMADKDVEDSTVLENSQPSTLNTSKWRAHTEADVHCEVP